MFPSILTKGFITKRTMAKRLWVNTSNLESKSKEELIGIITIKDVLHYDKP